jgi:hypothetical protein
MDLRSEVTREDALAMVKDCEALLAEFQAGGPTTPGLTLANGAALMAAFTEKLAEANKRREALSTAERLFGLPATRYEQLSTIREAMGVVAPLYALYGDLVAFKDTNAATPWSQLDVASLQKGAEDMAKRALKLKDLKASPVYPLVSDEVLGFWFEETAPAQWWKKDAAFDAVVARRFAGLQREIDAGESWCVEPHRPWRFDGSRLGEQQGGDGLAAAVAGVSQRTFEAPASKLRLRQLDPQARAQALERAPHAARQVLQRRL